MVVELGIERIVKFLMILVEGCYLLMGEDMCEDGLFVNRGEGKWVGLNGMVRCLLYKKDGGEVKFVIVEGKKVELGMYGGIEKDFVGKVGDGEEGIMRDVRKVVERLK